MEDSADFASKNQEQAQEEIAEGGEDINKFAVVDVETTGFGAKDRIIELGIILIDEDKITHEWETLVNPERDISNSDIHGITASMVSLAPTFKEIEGELAELLNDRILIAHNISFDSKMIINEYSRFDKIIDLGKGFCTLKATNAKLEIACEELGLENYLAHSALSDARATAQIFKKIYQSDDDLVPMVIKKGDFLAISQKVSRGAFSGQTSSKKPLTRILRKYDLSEEREPELSYLDVLSYFLSDLRITKDEKKQLNELANDLGIAGDYQAKVHKKFLDSIIEAAKRDNFVSEYEKKSIAEIASQLDLPIPNLANNIKENPVLKFEKGMRICFTGESRDEQGNTIERSFLFELAQTNGFIPVETVTKKSCDLLVAADKSSMSGKAKKARDFGINVISTDEFLSYIQK